MSDTEDRPQYRINESRYFRQQVARAHADEMMWTQQSADRYQYPASVMRRIRYYTGNGSCIPTMQHNAFNGGRSVMSVGFPDIGPENIVSTQISFDHEGVLGDDGEAFAMPLVNSLDVVQLSDFNSAGVALGLLNHNLSLGGAFLGLLTELPDD